MALYIERRSAFGFPPLGAKFTEGSDEVLCWLAYRRHSVAEKWEDKLVELESTVVDYIRTIPRSDRHKIIRRLHERVRRLEELVEGIDDIQ
jgi:hypothetical protein